MHQCHRLLVLALATSSTLCSALQGVSSPSHSTSDDSIPLSRLPWVVLPKNVTGFTGRVSEEDCVGLMVSPTAALMAASCIEINPATAFSVAVLLAEGSALEVGDFAEPGLPHWRLRDPVSVVVHPQSRDSLRAHNFALVRWQDPIPGPTTPVLLDAMGDKRLSRQEDDQDEILAVILGGTETDVVTRRSRTACVGDFDSQPVGGLVCVEAKWKSEQLCSQLSNRNGFITRSTLDRVVVSGIIPETVNCGVTDDTTAPTIGHAAVSLLVNAREFIDQTLNGHVWLEDLVSSSSSSSADASAGDEDWYGTVEEPDPAPIPLVTKPPVALWRRDLSEDKAYLSQEPELTTDPRNAQDGGFAVLITPQFLLTRASWVRGLQSIQYAHFGDQTIRIRRVIFDQLPNIQSNEQLVVVELEHEPDGRVVVPLATVTPRENVDLEMLQTVVMDENSYVAANDTPSAIQTSFNLNAIVSRSVCQPLTQTRADSVGDLLCVQSSDRVVNVPLARSYVPFNASFLTVGDSLLALSWGSSATNAVGQVAQTYQPLGSSLRERKFLDQATTGSVVWSDGDPSSQEPLSLGLGRILLYGNDSSATDGVVAIPCGAIMVSPQFYLTKASCLGDAQVAWAVYERRENVDFKRVVKTLDVTEELIETTEPVGETSSPVSEAADPKEGEGDSEPTDEPLPPWSPLKGAIRVVSVVIHPSYASSRQGVFDFAIIRLAKVDDTVESNVRLWSEPLSPQSRVIEHELVGEEIADRASLVVDASECGLETDGDMLCVSPPQPSPSPQCSDGGDTDGLFYRVGATVLFVGFSHPQSTGDCSIHGQYSQVATILNFINAVVDKPTWGLPSFAQAYVSKLPQPGLVVQPSLRKPYVVGLRMTKDGQNFCGGSLISSQFVLTAAHCVTDGLANWVSIGSAESAGLNTEPIQVNTRRTRIHPQYKSPYRYSHDAAILELSVPAYEEKIALDSSVDFYDGDAATMYGYGVDSATSTALSSTMHARDLTLLSKTTCARTLPDIDDSVLCAMAANGLDACTGDSGSPLVVKDEASGREQLVGVVSAGYGCGVAGVPGLYTRVASVASFINAYSIDPTWVRGHPISAGGTKAPGVTPSTVPSPSGASPSSTATPVTTAKPPASVGSGSGSSSQATDLSELPLEERNSQMTGSPSSSPPPSSSTSSTLPPASASVFEAAIVKTSLPINSLSVLTETALMQFLIGDYSNLDLPSALRQAIASPHNAVAFFSTDDVNGLLRVLSTHNATPLNQRKDRFHTAELSSSARLQAVQATSCPGH